MKTRQRIVLPTGHALHVEFVRHHVWEKWHAIEVPRSDDYWFIWLGANTAFTDGFGVRLYTDGRMEHWRIHPDGYEERLDKENT